MSRAPITRRLPGGLRCALTALILSGLTAAPLAAQTAAPPQDDTAIIDLGAALEAPETLAPQEDPSLGETPPVQTPEQIERPPEIVDEALLTLPQYTRSDVSPEISDATPDETSGAPLMMPGDDVLLPLQSLRPTLEGIVRLTGEVQSEDFFVDLPLAGAAHDLVLSYRIAINVLPEQSELRIRVNGTDLEPVRPTAFEGFEQLILPGSLLVAGRNEITVAVHHAHRIFCGPDATFAVWSEINTNISGVRLARTDLPVDAVGFQMALRAQMARSGNLPVRFVDPSTAGLLDRLVPRLAGLRDGAPTVLERQSPYSVIDDLPQMARITVMPGDAAPRSEVRRAADGALVLVLTTGFDGTMPDLDTLLPLPAAVPNVALLPPGTTTTLRDLQFSQTQAYNRYSEQQVTFRLPDDWLILASQKAMLRLVYSFADGLAEGSIMLVKVNDTTVRLLPLDRDGGKDLPTLEIDFPARLLVPGNNAVTFVSIIPGDPPELPCPTLTGPLVTIGEQSTLMAPPSPRMRMMGLDRPLVSMRPNQLTIVAGTAEEASASENLMATVAAALRPVAQTDRIADASLTVTYGTGISQLPLDELGITRRNLTRVLAMERVAPPARQLSEEGDGLPPKEDGLPPEEGARASAGQDGAPQRGVLKRIRDAVVGGATVIYRLAVPGDGPLAPWLEGRTAEAVLFIPDDAAPHALWLLVNPQTDAGRMATILAQARLSAQGPKGRLSLLDADGKWESWHTTRTAPTLNEPLTIGNFRQVAGNYASWSPLYFTAVLLVLTLVSASLALVFIITTRGKRKK